MRPTSSCPRDRQRGRRGSRRSGLIVAARASTILNPDKLRVNHCPGNDAIPLLNLAKLAALVLF